MADVHEQVREHICALSDDALVTYIVTGVHAYEPEAVEYAREEFKRRKLDPAIVAEWEAQAVSHRLANQAASAEAAQRSLHWTDLILAFLAGFFMHGLIHLVIEDTEFYTRGESRKAGQMWKATIAGFVTVVAVLIIAGCWIRRTR